MVEEKEVKESSIALYRLSIIEPVLTHLEEIAEMNERLRAKCEFYYFLVMYSNKRNEYE